MSKLKIKGAIFDMDGTLLDSMFIWETVGSLYLRHLGFCDVDGYNKIFRSMSLADAVAICRKELCIQKSVEYLMKDVNDFAEKMYIEQAKPKEDVIEFLDRLKGMNVKMCVATATDIEPVTAALKKNYMLSYFDEIFTETSVGSGKTEPYMFMEALRFLGTDKCETWIFEDALYAVKTARRNNFNVVGVYDKSEKNPQKVGELADIYIHKYEELKVIF